MKSYMQSRVLLWLMAGMIAGATPGVAGAQHVLVVVNAANGVSTLTRDQVTAMFLKKTTVWNRDVTIVPIDQPKRSKARETFAKEVLGRSAAAIETYWQTQIFSGRDVPPIVRNNDADVLAFVRSHRDAIGYVTAGISLGTGVKAVPLRE